MYDKHSYDKDNDIDYEIVNFPLLDDNLHIVPLNKCKFLNLEDKLEYVVMKITLMIMIFLSNQLLKQGCRFSEA